MTSQALHIDGVVVYHSSTNQKATFPVLRPLTLAEEANRLFNRRLAEKILASGDLGFTM
jgi:hypothetical protein